ncbi:MAG: HAMP domain-containing protein [Actinomycetia bacterium]|nr:HAMP domain-containing protein [Actinomycetes bacterium]
MISQIGLRARLTIFVTIVFAAALTMTSVLVIEAVEDRLVADTRASAEAVLSGYLESIYGGVATVGVVDPEATSRFFYLDAAGQEISEYDYFETLMASFNEHPPAIIPIDQLGGPFDNRGAIPASGGIITSASTVGLAVDATSGVLSGPDGTSIAIAGPVPTGEPRRIDLGDDVVAVAQTLTFTDGATIEVGVSNPLRPVTDSLDAITGLLWFAVPALVLATSLITWLAASRALRPVAAIATQAGAITAANIDQRVPVHDANDEVRHLAVTVNNMLDRLQQARDRQRQLVADASHELRSPVAVSRAQLEVAAASPDTTDWAATTEAVLAEQERLTTLIDDLLTLSRLDETSLGSATDIDLDDIIVDEAGRQPADIDITAAVPVRIAGNQQLITRAIRNLLDNAARHANDHVAVTLASDDQHATIHVDDDGPGIPVDQHEHVFERFTRLDEARDRSGGGAGLGLAIAREVARAHQGDLTCTRGPLGGARFTLTIPTQTSP